MKKLIFFISILVFFTFAVNGAVIVNGVDINKEDIRFCELVAKGKLLSKKVTIIVDYGQKQKLFGKEQVITDSSGKKKQFYSVIDALNFMDKNGWEYVDRYFITSGSSNVLHFLFRKKK